MSDTMQAPVESDLNQLSGPGGDDNRRKFVLLAALVGIIVIAAAAYFLFLSGGGEDEELGLVAPGVVNEDNGNEQNGGAGGDEEGTKLPEEFQGEVGQDPFKPLAAEAPVADTSDTGSVTGTDSGVGTSTGSGDGATTTTTTIAVKVASVDVKAGKATILVDGKSYTVKEGEVFPSATTGPFKAVTVGTTDGGEAFVKVAYGSDLPVILQEGKEVTFGQV